jgi:hypothetical protein
MVKTYFWQDKEKNTSVGLYLLAYIGILIQGCAAKTAVKTKREDLLYDNLYTTGLR